MSSEGPGSSLPGGQINEVVRVGSTVRRPMGANAEYVHGLLGVLEKYGWPGAPRYLGVDEEGREILTYLPGHVAWEPQQPPAVWSEASLTRVARLMRQFHDLTVGTWLAGDAEVACHNDLAPRNTVYEQPEYRPYAFIDWDLAAPGRRVHDVALVCWQFLDLGPTRSDPAGVGRLMRLICDTYELARSDRAELVETVLWWQDRCARGIEERAAEGDPAMEQLVEDGAVEKVRTAYEWTEANADILGVLVTQRDPK